MSLPLLCFYFVCPSPYQLKPCVSLHLYNHSAFLRFYFMHFFCNAWYNSFSTFFPVCGQPLGVTRGVNNELPDSRMKASSATWLYPASRGRLKDRGWSPMGRDEDPYPYLEIDLGNLYLVCGIKVQGCSEKRAGEIRYRVQVSPEENFWDSWNYLKVWFYSEARYS